MTTLHSSHIMTYTFGVQKPCTPQQLSLETKELYAKCVLSDMGTFYFVYSKEEPKNGRYQVMLKFYDNNNQVLHTSSTGVLSSGKTSQLTSSCAFDHCTFLIGPFSSGFHVVVLNEDWSSSKMMIPKDGRRDLAMALLGDSSLSKIRTGTPGDFELKSEEGESVSVHTTVLSPLWPFFSAALKADMSEAADKTMQLQCPTSTVEVIVRFFYDQDLGMSFDDAANLVVVAPMYDIPDQLLKQAVNFIKDRDMTVEENLTVWEKSVEAKNESLRKYCASKLKEKMPDVVKSQERIGDWSKEDILTLLMDISGSFGGWRYS